MSRVAEQTQWVGRVFEIFRKVFNAGTFTLEQEKRLKGIMRRARSEDVALEAIDLIYQEGVRYPTGMELASAITRCNAKLDAAQRPDYGSGPFVSFREWFAAQDDEMKERVQRVAPSLKAFGVMK